MRKVHAITSALAATFSLACSPVAPTTDEKSAELGVVVEAKLNPIEMPEYEPVVTGTISVGGELSLGHAPSNALIGFRFASTEEAPEDFAAPVSVSELATSGILDTLGELTGFYEISVTRLEDDCTYGPDVPFDRDRGLWLGIPGTATFPLSQKYYTHLVHRGDVVGFELGEGIVFARPAEGLLTEVERVGADGVTLYQDDFSVGSDADDRTLISGESSWVFHDDYQAAGEVCTGRTSWEMLRIREAPTGNSRDLHFSLRWSAESDEDLDLVIGRPFTNMTTASGDHSKNYLGEVDGECFVVRSIGYALAEEGVIEPTGFVDALSATTLPFHEEIISCSWPPYGRFKVDVVNWNSSNEVYYELGAYRGALGENRLGYTTGNISPLEMDSKIFDHAPPPADSAAALIMTSSIRRQPAQRLADSVSRSFLGFNKAAYEGFSYEEFLAELGL